MNVFFDTKNIYYLPQYKPVIDVLVQRGHECHLVSYQDKNNVAMVENHCHDVSATLIWVENETAALQCYLDNKPDWVFFANQFAQLDLLHQFSKTAQMSHGIGPKFSYYTQSRTQTTVRFIEGPERLKIIKKMFPNGCFEQVGYSKLDPIFLGQELGIDLLSIGLNSSLKTILYAPTFNPSSIECFPDDWPNQFLNSNIIIKPHTFTFTKKRYHKQRLKLKKWAEFKNVYIAKIEDVSILPFMVTADILLSESSSTLFEFAALNKPVIVCDFFRLSWFHRGIFKYRFNKRFKKDSFFYQDIGLHIDRYDLLHQAVYGQLKCPVEFSQGREIITSKHVGQADGNVSVRIAEYLENY